MIEIIAKERDEKEPLLFDGSFTLNGEFKLNGETGNMKGKKELNNPEERIETLEQKIADLETIIQDQLSIKEFKTIMEEVKDNIEKEIKSALSIL